MCNGKLMHSLSLSLSLYHIQLAVSKVDKDRYNNYTCMESGLWIMTWLLWVVLRSRCNGTVTIHYPVIRQAVRLLHVPLHTGYATCNYSLLPLALSLSLSLSLSLLECRVGQREWESCDERRVDAGLPDEEWGGRWHDTWRANLPCVASSLLSVLYIFLHNFDHGALRADILYTRYIPLTHTHV